MIHRNVDVVGLRIKGHTGVSRPASIDWSDVSKVVIAERGAVVFFHELVIYQAEMGIGGLNLPFIQTRRGATGVFAGMAVVVAACPQRVNLYDQLASELPRPEFLAGKQTTMAMDDESLLVKDVAIWWPNINSLWQICNTVFICGLTGPDSHRVARHFENMETMSRCETGEKLGDGEEEQARLELERRDKRKASMGMAATAIVIVVVVGVVLLATGGTTYYVCGRQKRALHLRNKDDQEGFKASKLNEKGAVTMRSHDQVDTDDRLQSHSAAYKFFENVDVPLDDVEMGPILGRGGFGKVYKGTWKGTTVAIKVIEHGKRLMDNTHRQPFEAYLSKHVSHPNVVQTFLIHTIQQDSPHGLAVDTGDLRADSISRVNPPHQSSVMTTHDIFSNIAQGPTVQEVGELYETWLILEYCDRGSLSKAVRRGVLTQSMKPKMDHVILSALDVANSMNYLHSLGITHGDLKADNVLLKSANTDRRGFFCKVSDFGLSRFMGTDDYIQTFTYGTITHMPPELLKDGILSPSVDVYSFGMLLWELLSKTEHPYPKKNHGEIILTVVNEGRRPNIGANYPEMYADLIKDCWKQNRHDRPDFPEIVTRLKGLLADQDHGNGGSPSKSISFPMNDSATSLKKRNDSVKRRTLLPRDIMTPSSEERNSIPMDSAYRKSKRTGSRTSETSETAQPMEKSTLSDQPSMEALPGSLEPLRDEDSEDDEFRSAYSHWTNSSRGSPTHLSGPREL